MNERDLMREALRLASLMKGRTSPDPMVGAVVVRAGKIVGKGYHGEASTPHAEAYALKKAGKFAAGATLYINLEPCCHHGNNPPCVDAIIKAKIKKVYAAMKDPNPLVSGRGFAKLRKHGIKVEVGLLCEEAKRLNEAFTKFITKRTPFVILKSAMSLDGKIATKTGESRWISSEASRRLVHKLRNEVDAVMTGINTVLKDDPMLTVRIKGKVRNPLKIVIDPKAETPLDCNILMNEPWKTIVVVSQDAHSKRIKDLRDADAEVIVTKLRWGVIDLKALMRELGSRGIMSIMIEAGGGLCESALRFGVVDKVLFFVAPKIIGGKGAVTPVEGEGVPKLSLAHRLYGLRCFKTGDDIALEAYISPITK
jgi:diaminohydroxyphosphoribosylaminopyrimidine deaminase/5-amino-6-(5-phosphoribosylamino)uracil reductase